MKKTTVVLAAILMGHFSQITHAQSLINDMQACQGLLDYMQQKLAKAPTQYETSRINAIQKALKSYDDYIQNTIITPGLLKFNGGNQTKAAAMQQQVDAYKHTITVSMIARDNSGQLTSNHAVSLNNCAKKAVPIGQNLTDLKAAINDIVAIAQSN